MSRESHTSETRSVSFLCQMAANFTLTQMLRHVLGLGKPVTDTIVQYCGFTHQTNITPLRRNAKCPLDHVAWETVAQSVALETCTLRALAAEAGITHPALIALTWFFIDELSYVEASTCRCGHSEPLGRFVPPAEPTGSCPRCGESLFPSEFLSHRPTAGAVILSELDRPVAELVRAPPRWIVVSCGERAVRFRNV